MTDFDPARTAAFRFRAFAEDATTAVVAPKPGLIIGWWALPVVMGAALCWYATLSLLV